MRGLAPLEGPVGDRGYVYPGSGGEIPWIGQGEQCRIGQRNQWVCRARKLKAGEVGNGSRHDLVSGPEKTNQQEMDQQGQQDEEEELFQRPKGF